MSFNPANWQQKQAMDAYADQREVKKARAKAIVKEQVKMQAREYREVQKEQEAERKKAVHEEIQILQNGKLQIITKNLRGDAMPRMVTNMEAPHLILLKRRKDESDTVLQLKFKIDGRDDEVFLNPDLIGSGTYLLKKFVAKGVRCYLPGVKKKLFLMEFLSMMIEDMSEERWLADNSGWIKKFNGHFVFVGEGDLTWKKAKKMAK